MGTCDAIGGGVAMRLTSGLAVSLAVLVTGFYTWGISTDPDGFRGLIRDRGQPVEGAIPLAAVGVPSDGISGVAHEDLTWKDVAGSLSQAVVFKLRPPAANSLDINFSTFLDNLTRAVAARDVVEVLALSAPNDFVAVDTNESLVGLEQLLTAPDSDATWEHLESVLALPVARGIDGSYCAPYFSCLAMPEDAGLVEPFETVFVTAENVPVYAEPSLTSEQLVTLSYDAVRLAAPIDDDKWLKVLLPADRSGYIAREQGRMMFESRADFARLPGGQWALTSLVIAP